MSHPGLAAAWRGLRLRGRRRLRLPRGAWALAGPVMLQELAVVLSAALIVGLAAHDGPRTVAAIGMVEALGQLLHALLGALAMGATVVAAHRSGAGRNEALRPLVWTALGLAGAGAAALALLLWPLQGLLLQTLLGSGDPAVLADAERYLRWLLVAEVPTALALVGCGLLRGLGRSAAASAVLGAMTLVHLLTAALTMRGLGWGPDGAGAALLLSRLLAALAVVWALKPVLRAPALGPRWQPDAAWRVLGVGWPAGMETLLFHAGKLLTQTLVAQAGTVALAANFVGFSISGLMNIPGTALGVAATTLVGQRLGAGSPVAAQRALAGIVRSATLLLSGLGLLLLPWSWWLAGRFGPDPQMVHAAGQVIALNCLFMPVWAWAFVLPAGLRGAADTRHVMAVAWAGMWLCRVALGWLLGVVWGWGLLGVWLGMFADWGVRAALYRRRFLSGAWQRQGRM